MGNALKFLVLVIGLAACAAYFGFAPMRPGHVVTNRDASGGDLAFAPATAATGLAVAQSNENNPASSGVTPEKTTTESHETLHIAGPEPLAGAARLTSTEPVDVEARRALARDLEAELVRLGCYKGPADGQWPVEAKRALETFTARFNAQRTSDEPDGALLSLARNQRDGSCIEGVAVQDASIEAPKAGETPAATIPGRMGLGAASSETEPQPATPRRSGRPPDVWPGELEKLFLHPLGQP